MSEGKIRPFEKEQSIVLVNEESKRECEKQMNLWL